MKGTGDFKNRNCRRSQKWKAQKFQKYYIQEISKKRNEAGTNEAKSISATPKKKKRILPICLLTLLAVVVLGAGGIFGLWHNEILSAASIQQLSGPNNAHQDGAVYQMKVSGDYYFDDFLAQGGASNDAELIDFVTKNITRGLIDVSISESDIACSSFTGATPEGHRLFGRNYDFKQTNTCIVFTKPGKGRHASVSTVDLQFIGIDKEKGISSLMDRIKSLAATYAPLDGMNDAGVSCGIYMTYQGGDETVPTDQNTDKPDLTSTTMLRMVLDYADSVEEAVEMISRYDLHDSAGTSYHYMIADSTGKSAILEWVNETDKTDNDGSKRKLTVTYNDNDPAMASRDYQCVTNFIVAPGYYASDEEKAGLDRYELLHSQLQEKGGLFADKEEAMGLLAQVGRRNWNNDDSNGCTVHSVVYDLTDRTVLWTGNDHYGEEGYVYEFQL